MTGPIYDYLAEDHLRLDRLLRDSMAYLDRIDNTAYEAFRAGLLRHIGLEEKILLPAAKRARGGVSLPIAGQLRRDHAALAALMVPTPTPEIVHAIRRILDRHNRLEEQEGGLYAQCEELLVAEAADIMARLRAAPEVPLAPHVDSPRVQAHIQLLLQGNGELSANR